jgi:uncharacterized protein with von Willebrand factor type A (vWA) domain
MTEIPALALVDRWRLILGQAAAAACGSQSEAAAAMDVVLDWLYGRDAELAERGEMRRGGSEASQLTTPEWINEIHRLFPRETIERLERDAIERFEIADLVTNPEVLQRAEPNETLLKAVLQTKNLMKPDVLAMARKLVQEVVKRLIDALAREYALAFAGVLDRRRRTRQPVPGGLDFRRVLRDNLRHYDAERRRIVVQRPSFFARSRRQSTPWQVILLVDQSGSMASSVIHSAVTAACLWGLPGVRTHLVAFDTGVVDLTKDVEDPVELLMNFCEGGDADALVGRVKVLASQRTRVLGLAALDREANPSYDRAMAERLVVAGAEVGAMTPGELASWLAEKIGR